MNKRTNKKYSKINKSSGTFILDFRVLFVYSLFVFSVTMRFFLKKEDSECVVSELDVGFSDPSQILSVCHSTELMPCTFVIKGHLDKLCSTCLLVGGNY